MDRSRELNPPGELVRPAHVLAEEGNPVLTSLPRGTFLLLLASSLPALMGVSAMYCWIYAASGSIWAPTLLHLFWNLYRGILTGRLSDGAPGLFAGPLWLINGERVLGNLVTAAFGVFFLILLVRRDRVPGSARGLFG